MSKIYTAVTIKDGTIVARHETAVPVTDDFFIGTPYEGMAWKMADGQTEYASGHKLKEYTEDGKMRPLVDLINDGLAPIPDGYEMIDGELVAKHQELKDTPEALQQTINRLRAEIDALQKLALGV